MSASKLPPLILSLLLLLTAGSQARAGALDNWQYRNPLPIGNALTNVTYGGGYYAATGVAGSLLVSTDGAKWTLAQTGSNTLNGIAYGAGTFVAAGLGGAIYTSTDAATWTAQNSGGTTDLYGVTYGRGLFVITGVSGTVLKSSDGVHWTSSNAGTSQNLFCATFANGTFVAGANGATLLSSTDASSWTTISLGGQSTFYAIAYGGGRFVAVGDLGSIYSSVDGLAWVKQTSAASIPTIFGVAYGAGSFVTVDGTGGTQVSTNGVSWANSTHLAGSPQALTYAAGRFVAVGYAASGSDQYAMIWTSTNASTWTVQSSNIDPDVLTAATDANGKLVVVGDAGAVLTSTDGIAYTPESLGSSPNANGVAYGNGELVAVSNLFTYTSADYGVTWQPSFLPTAYQGVGYGNGLFVEVGGAGAISTSTDNGGTWDAQTRVGDDLNGVTYGNGLYIAVGSVSGSSAGAIISSTDGATWTPASIGNVGQLNSVSYNGTRFVAAGLKGLIVTSTNGSTWAQTPSGSTSDLASVTYGGGSFLAVGAAGTLLSSTDGLAWVQRAPYLAQPHTLYGATFFRGTFVAVGGGGTIIESQALPGVGPRVITGGTTAIAPYSATVSGTVTPNASPTTVSVEYATNALFANSMVTSGTTLASGTSAIPLSVNLGGLLSGRDYFYRFLAVNSEAAQTGSTRAFATIAVPPVVTATASATGTTGVPFSYQFIATNNPTSYGASGLPSGLSVDTASGLVSGVPFASGTFSATIVATNAAGSGTGTLNLSIAQGTVPAISSTLSVTGSAGLPFSYQITAVNNPAYFDATGLPEGLTVDHNTGLIHGTPALTGQVSVSSVYLTASNSFGTGSAVLNLTLNQPPVLITGASSATGAAGVPFTYQIQAVVLSGSVAYTAQGLPSGLQVNPANGFISGTPLATGSYGVTLMASTVSGSASAPLNLLIGPNPGSLKGNYSGLATLGGANAGLLKITLTGRNAFTGKLQTPAAAYSFSGVFSSGTFGTVISKPPLVLAVGLNFNTWAPSISGTIIVVTNGVSNTYIVNTETAGKFSSTPLAGRYTVILPGLSGSDPATPHATGYGTMSVGKTGSVHIAGKLGDGTPCTFSSTLNSDGTSCAFYEALYGKTHGFAAGNLAFASGTASDASGAVDWEKPVQPGGALYSSGFQVRVPILAATYKAPALKTGSGSIQLGGGGLSAGQVSGMLTVNSSGKVSLIGIDRLTLSLSAGTGAFTGSFANPLTKKTSSYGGVIFQKPVPAGFGLFIGVDQTGTVTITQ